MIWQCLNPETEFNTKFLSVSAKAIKTCMFYPDPMISHVNIHRMNVTSFSNISYCINCEIIRRVRNSQTSFPNQLIPYPQPARGNRLRHASGPVPRTRETKYPTVHLSVTWITEPHQIRSYFTNCQYRFSNFTMQKRALYSGSHLM